MTEAEVKYDELSDTFYVSFAPGEQATGVELSDHILLRINQLEHSAVGLIIFEYSLLAQTDGGRAAQCAINRSC